MGGAPPGPGHQLARRDVAWPHHRTSSAKSSESWLGRPSIDASGAGVIARREVAGQRRWSTPYINKIDNKFEYIQAKSEAKSSSSSNAEQAHRKTTDSIHSMDRPKE